MDLGADDAHVEEDHMIAEYTGTVSKRSGRVRMGEQASLFEVVDVNIADADGKLEINRRNSPRHPEC